MTYFCRGIRGATTAEANTREAILEATRDLLERLILPRMICARKISPARSLAPRPISTLNFRPSPRARWAGSIPRCSAHTRWPCPAAWSAVSGC